MNTIEQKIIQSISLNPEKEFSTSELVKQVFKKEHDDSEKQINNPQKDQELIKIGKRNKARLHRKLLYHLNNLSEEEVLKTTKITEKGEKYFLLILDKISQREKNKNEQVKKIVESYSMIKNEAPLLAGIETYEEQGIVKRFDSNNWLNKLNALIIESTLIQDTKQLYDLTSDLYQVYNDVLGIIDFQHVVDTNEMSELTNFIRKTNTDTKDYNKYINLIIDLKNTKNTVKLTDFLRAYADINPDKIFVILQTNTKTLNNNNRLISQVIKSFSENKIRINIQNLDLKEAPYMIGRAGAYTLEDQDWNTYKESFRKKTIGICISETSIYIDIYRAFKDKVNYSEFRELILKSSKALLLATATQRKRSDILFKPLNKINKELQNKFFSLSNNYIRLWNYDLLFMNQNQEEKNDETGFTMFNHLLLSIVEELNEFCKSEETIFRSCGIPIRFKIVMSSAFRRFDPEFLSPRIYKKVTIKKIDDLTSEQITKEIRRRESLYKVFKGGDRVRFFRATESIPEEIISEFHLILNTYNIPLFSYDFRSLKGELTLHSFI